MLAPEEGGGRRALVEVGRDELRAEGLEDGVENVSSLDAYGIPVLVVQYQFPFPKDVARLRAYINIFHQLSAFLPYALGYARRQLHA
jgi:hypothetical protein